MLPRMSTGGAWLGATSPACAESEAYVRHRDRLLGETNANLHHGLRESLSPTIRRVK